MNRSRNISGIVLCVIVTITWVSYHLLTPGCGKKYEPPPLRWYFNVLNNSIATDYYQQHTTTEFAELLNLTRWPDLSLKELKFTDSTSPKETQYHIINKRDLYKVGETLDVLITTKDHMGRLKTYGGDFFQTKLHSSKKKAGVPGQVKDYGNGSYLATFLLPWSGEAQVNIRLIHSSEAIAVLKDKRDKYPEKVYFNGYFESLGVSEVTECNLKISGKNVCEFNDPAAGEIWQCVRPKTLPCDSWRYHSMGGYRQVTNSLENSFLSGSVTDHNIPSSEPPVNIVQSNSSLTSKLPVCKTNLEPSLPSGYYYEDQWTSLVCLGQHFSKPDDARACLRGRDIYMFGDSTLRQWFEYLEQFIPSLGRIDLHLNYQSGPLLAVDPDYGIVMRWRAHGLPLRTTKTAQISQIGGGPYTVVVITLWAHFTNYPLAVYLQRLVRVCKAVESLSTRSPQTTVLFKSANTGYKTVYGSDWLSLQLDILMRAAFKGMAVTVLDAWDMTSCHYLPDGIHPGPPVIRNEVDLMLSYICPK
uniref:NXPE C-terminal domain-containing protein n=1 Tax=Leptobrachium leishanense TaxID=445787 RepID=A0A8C5MS36_9ANUR